MRYTKQQQREMDAEWSRVYDLRERERRQKLPCKNKSRECRHDGGCLRCDADAGEDCRAHYYPPSGAPKPASTGAAP
jgi:hypothetical protein